MAVSLESWGWDEQWGAELREMDRVECRPGRVVEHHRDRWIVHTSAGARDARLGRDTRPPVVGDWVLTEPGRDPADPWLIVDLLARRSAVARASAGDGRVPQVLASNVDRLWIVQGLDAPPNPRRLERYLAVGWESGARAEVVLTKSDLATELDHAVDRVRAIAFDAPLWVVSVSDPSALAELEASLSPGSTIALIGPSGTGKSTLVNVLAGARLAETGEVRARDRKGRHTTTSRSLHRIRNGALLIDTPGLRELRVLALETGLSRAFPEIDELAQHCRFRDCSHLTDPGCAVVAAVGDGTLAADRLESYRKLEAEAAHERRKLDPRARADLVAEHKTAMKTLRRHHPRYRPDD